MSLQRPIDRWRTCVPASMAHAQSPAAIQFAFADAKADILALYALVERVARLNPDAGELAAIVEQARKLTNSASST